jgi:uncharacterized DUF497 family protein
VWSEGTVLSPPGFRNTFGRWEVHRSALKHEIDAADTVHAVRNALIVYALTNSEEEGPPRELHLGPDRAGNLLEVVVLVRDEGPGLIIHSMRMRPRYRELLP